MPALVIVESPAKAKTISRYLGDDYVVEASYGHIRDLPAKAAEIPAKFKKEAWARLGVNVEDDFEPLYIVPTDKKKYVTKLKDALKNAELVLLATDEDREGESISWHVIEVLKPKVPVQRIAFHEVTKEAIQEAVASPRDLDEGLIRAQESRRILDRLFGYMLSPLLWKKVAPRLSAGRVQSVAVRIAVLRERERRAFKMATYWDAEATFEESGSRFTAKLLKIDDQSLASGDAFEQNTGEMKATSKALWLKTGDETNSLLDAMSRPFEVAKVETKPFSRRPAAPFTTSTLQQEANRKLRFAAKRTMRAAQDLYEGIDLGAERIGLITYMRTDSLTLSERALEQAVEVIGERYGAEYTVGPRRYKTKTANAQEAHEAIRPTDLSRTPEDVRQYLNDDQYRLYELIWKRTLASQMTDARLLRTSIEIDAKLADGRVAKFTTSGQTIEFAGFLRAYVEGSDDPSAEIADKETVLPPLQQGQPVTPVELDAKKHETSPPARYTEASLVKKLEEEGIGRPSTYASIIGTIQDRGYINKQGNALVPTFTAFAVTKLLESHFHEYIDLQFTARMEQELDEIANGNKDYREQLRRMYYGNGNGTPGLEAMSTTKDSSIDYPEVELGSHPESGHPVVVKVGRYGPYVQCGVDDDRIMASIPQDAAPADFKLEQAVELLRKKAEGPQSLGEDPKTGMQVYLLAGRFGPYFQLGETPTEKGADKPKRASLPRAVSEADATLELALKLLSLPRTVGLHPKDGEPVLALKGRFGPHLRWGEETRSLQDDDQVFNITLEEAVAKLNEPKRSRRQQRTVLREIGVDPKEETMVQVLEGPYGAYLTNTALNASLPDNVSWEKVDLKEALEILAERGKAPKRRAAAKTSKKKATKKKATKKKAAKKKTTKKKATKKKTAKKSAAKKVTTGAS